MPLYIPNEFFDPTSHPIFEELRKYIHEKWEQSVIEEWLPEDRMAYLSGPDCNNIVYYNYKALIQRTAERQFFTAFFGAVSAVRSIVLPGLRNLADDNGYALVTHLFVRIEEPDVPKDILQNVKKSKQEIPTLHQVSALSLDITQLDPKRDLYVAIAAEPVID